MKPLLIIVLLSLFAIDLRAQENKQQDQDSETTIKLHNAGSKLITAGTIFYAGFSTTAIGAGIMLTGGATANTSLVIIGGLITTAGSILTFASWAHVIKAGKILKGTAYLSQDGLTLAYQF